MKSLFHPAGPRLERLPVEERNFKGHDPRGRPEGVADAAQDTLDGHWRRAKAYDRKAVLLARDLVASTGTLVLTFRVTDGGPFDFLPGQFVGLVAPRGRVRRLRSPYCILSSGSAGVAGSAGSAGWAADDDGTFRILVRVVPDGPLSLQLAELSPGDVIEFRGPTGRSMLPREGGTELVLLATGVGVSPLVALADRLLRTGDTRPIRLLWGLRLEEDICLVDELDELAVAYPNFSYQISLSRPGPAWRGLRGRLSESVPEVIGDLRGKHFYLVGNGDMTSAFADALRELGVDETLIYQEAFFNGHLRGEPHEVAELRTRLSGGLRLSPVITGGVELFPLQRPLTHPRERLAS